MTPIQDEKMPAEFIHICDLAGVIVGSTQYKILKNYWDAKDSKHQKEMGEKKQLALEFANELTMAREKIKDLEAEVARLDKLAYLEGEPGHETTWKQEAELLLEKLQVMERALKAVIDTWRKAGASPDPLFDQCLEALKPPVKSEESQ